MAPENATVTVEAPSQGIETQPPETVADTAVAETPEETSADTQLDTSTSEEGTEEETPTASPEGEPEAPVETPDVTVDADATPSPIGLDDETLNTIAEVYGDKIIESPALKDRVSQSAKSQADKQIAAAEATRSSQVQTDKILQQGKEALDTVVGQIASAQTLSEQLGKVKSGDLEIDSVSLPADLSETALKQAMVSYGQATAASGIRSYESGLNSAFRTTFAGDVLPGLTKEQAEEIRKITATASRIENDPLQGEQVSKNYLFTNLFKFIAERGVEQGTTKEKNMSEKKRSLAEKIAGDNVNVAAAAKAKAEEKSPPVAPESRPAEADMGPSVEKYNQLKADGKTAEAQDVLNRMAAARR